MRPDSQANFRRRVKVWLAQNDLNVTELAKRVGRRRDTVSTAIHSERFPRVRSKIAEAIAR